MWVDEYELASPPRRVSPVIQLGVLLGGVLAQIGWGLFGFGMIFAWVFVNPVALTDLVAFSNAATAEGTVTQATGTNASVNERTVMEYTFAFADGEGSQHTGTCYSTDHLSAGSTVTIEYDPGDPATSRIEGMRRSTFGLVVYLVLIFPGIGLGMILFGLKKGRRGVYLLRNGRLANGTFVSKSPTGTIINNQPVYELTFEFEAADGNTYQAKARNHKIEALTDEKQERILYDPMSPRVSCLWDNLPGSGRVDAMGYLVADGLGALKNAILPALVVGGNLVVCVLLYGA